MILESLLFGQEFRDEAAIEWHTHRGLFQVMTVEKSYLMVSSLRFIIPCHPLAMKVRSLKWIRHGIPRDQVREPDRNPAAFGGTSMEQTGTWREMI
jgi:hypothetical protein